MPGRTSLFIPFTSCDSCDILAEISLSDLSTEGTLREWVVDFTTNLGCRMATLQVNAHAKHEGPPGRRIKPNIHG